MIQALTMMMQIVWKNKISFVVILIGGLLLLYINRDNSQNQNFNSDHVNYDSEFTYNDYSHIEHFAEAFAIATKDNQSYFYWNDNFFSTKVKGN